VPVLSPDEWTAIALSLKVAFWATVLSIPLGIAIAFVLARKSFWGKSLLDGLVLLPLVLPPVVTGYFLLILFGRNGPLGALLAQFGVVLAFRWTGAVLSCGIMAFPLMVRAMRVSFEPSTSGSRRPRQRSEPARCGGSSPSRCRSRCPG